MHTQALTYHRAVVVKSFWFVSVYWCVGRERERKKERERERERELC